MASASLLLIGCVRRARLGFVEGGGKRGAAPGSVRGARKARTYLLALERYALVVSARNLHGDAASIG
jgi:hypothetical protein